MLSAERLEPQFFISILTDVEGKRLYCPCLTFSEAVTKESLGITEEADEEEEEEAVGGPMSLATVRSTSLPRHVVPGVSLPTSQDPGLMFAPKCLALVSR